MGGWLLDVNRACSLYLVSLMSGVESVSSAYLAVALMTLVGIMVPLGAFVTTWFLRPRTDPSRPNITRSWLLEGYETDHSLYPRRLSTYECGSEPIGDAMIQFHFQYYWYAIIFLVFDVAFMFLALAGIVVDDSTSSGSKMSLEQAESKLLIASAFFAIVVAGVWHVFRKRGRIYI
jgi:NADH:ubiquinone oxidoreductase subunit 3 (subunit A)